MGTTILLKNFPFSVVSSHLSQNSNSNHKTLLKGKISQDAKELCFAALLQTFWAWFSYPHRSNLICPTVCEVCAQDWQIQHQIYGRPPLFWSRQDILGHLKREQMISSVSTLVVWLWSVNVLLKWIAGSSSLPESGLWSCLEVHRLYFFLLKIGCTS